MKSLFAILSQMTQSAVEASPERASTSKSLWWESRRLRYNLGVVFSSLAASSCYLVIGDNLLPDEAEFEITIFTLAFQGIGFLIMMVIANLCYFLGPLSERGVKAEDLEGHRQHYFRLGFGFSVLLPFTFPFLLWLFHA